ncbi:MAG TPA: Twin-arginine translocation pathway signal, partial [Rhizobiales bacterium]|nr:Twin-arginine translocation pathway signal [Hyphomicrobiales bacterium]
QKIRGGLVTGLYNRKDVWAKLGYEGESASKGGYIDRGFDDIDWL